MITDLLSRLDKVKPHGKNKWMACCPAHEDRDPSMAVSELHDGRILIHCFAGCAPIDIVQSVGLTMGDLFPDGCLGEMKGFQQLQNDIAARKAQKADMASDKLYLELCQDARSRGEKLPPKTLEKERQAYLRAKG